MGSPKQLLPLGSKPVLRHCVDTLAETGIGNIVVVVFGSVHDACVHALEGSGAVIVPTSAECSQLADAARLGLPALQGECEYSGVVVALADHPLVSKETCRTIARCHGEMPDKIIIPSYRGKRGHPCLFPAEVICDIFFAGSLRDLVRENEELVVLIDVTDEGTVIDMDTQEDYRAVLEKFEARERSGGRHVQ